MSADGAGPHHHGSRTVVLFEGRSDIAAFQAVARRHGASLAGLELVELGGITNLRRELSARWSPPDRMLGLYDAAEEHYVEGVLRDVGMLEAGDPRSIGFFGCDRDLEDEVIRAAGPDLVLAALEARDELARFRVFQEQPAQRGRPITDQLHRFAGTAAGRKTRFAADVVEAIPLERMPRPLEGLLEAALHPR